MNLLKILLIIILSGLFFTGCQDTPPVDYLPEYVVEAYLLVDKPLNNIVISRSLPVTDTFSFEKSIVKDARVSIIVNLKDTLNLQFRNNERGGEYYYPDTTLRIQPNTTYNLYISTNEGKVLTGLTRTPGRVQWIAPPRQVLEYPKDTVNFPRNDSLDLQWSKVPNINEYLIAVTCLDTMGYGEYLNPSTSEKNRRIKRFFDTEDNPFYYNATLYGFIQGTTVPVAWTAFRWFGRHRITIYAADENFVRWFKTLWTGSQYDPRLGSINGGAGVFGSASVAEQDVFLVKNQP
jgi:hypothetical protein